jgi:hypothetical protein
MMDRATVSPPTPESNTPMGRDPISLVVWMLADWMLSLLLAGESATAPAAGSMLDAEVMIIRG